MSTISGRSAELSISWLRWSRERCFAVLRLRRMGKRRLKSSPSFRRAHLWVLLARPIRPTRFKKNQNWTRRGNRSLSEKACGACFVTHRGEPGPRRQFLIQICGLRRLKTQLTDSNLFWTHSGESRIVSRWREAILIRSQETLKMRGRLVQMSRLGHGALKVLRPSAHAASWNCSPAAAPSSDGKYRNSV
jgi:hypothetical protein